MVRDDIPPTNYCNAKLDIVTEETGSEFMKIIGQMRAAVPFKPCNSHWL